MADAIEKGINRLALEVGKSRMRHTSWARSLDRWVTVLSLSLTGRTDTMTYGQAAQCCTGNESYCRLWR